MFLQGFRRGISELSWWIIFYTVLAIVVLIMTDLTFENNLITYETIISISITILSCFIILLFGNRTNDVDFWDYFLFFIIFILYGAIGYIAISSSSQYVASSVTVLMWTCGVFFAGCIAVLVISRSLGTLYNKKFFPISYLVSRLPWIRRITVFLLFYLGTQTIITWPVIEDYENVDAQTLRTQLTTTTTYFPQLPVQLTSQFPQQLADLVTVETIINLTLILLVILTLLYSSYRIFKENSYRGNTGNRSNNSLWEWFKHLASPKTFWPIPSLSPLREIAVDKNIQAQERNYIITISYSAVSLIFALWTTRFLGGGASNGDEIYLANNILVAFILLIYLIGSSEVVIETIDLSSVRGTNYSIGLFIACLILFWITTLVVLQSFNGILEYSIQVASRDEFVFGIVFAYRIITGTITVILALNYATDEIYNSHTRNIRNGIAVSVLLVFFSFGYQVWFDGSANESEISSYFSIFISVIISILIIEVPSRLRQFRGRNLQKVDLLMSSSMAVAPVLLGMKDAIFQWVDDERTEIIYEKDGENQNHTLQLHIVHSEESVAYEVIERIKRRNYVSHFITDINTAISIIAHARDIRKDKNLYQIIGVVGNVPWTHMDVLSREDLFRLDAGNLLYRTDFLYERPKPTGSGKARLNYRYSNFMTISDFAIDSSQVRTVDLPEPYATSVRRILNKSTPPIHPKPYNEDNLYVIVGLTSTNVENRQVLSDLLNHGRHEAQANRIIIDQQNLKRVYDFYQRLSLNTLRLNIEDLYLALCKCSFFLHLPTKLHDKQNGDFDLQSTIDLVSKHDTILRPNNNVETNQNFVEILRSTEPPLLSPTFSNEISMNGGYNSQVSKYLHNVFLVSVPNSPGALEQMLEVINDNSNWLLMASASLGDSVLVYLISTSFFYTIEDKDTDPDSEDVNGKVGKILNKSLRLPLGSSLDLSVQLTLEKWSESLLNIRSISTEIKAFIIPIDDTNNQLRELLSFVKVKSPELNIEQAFVCRYSEKIALAFIVVRETQYKLFLDIFNQNTSVE